MKSRQEFTKETDYKDYLKYYFAGQALAGITVYTDSNDPLKISKNASEIGRQTVIRLETDDKEQREYNQPEEIPE